MDSSINFYKGKYFSFEIHEINETDSTNAELERKLDSLKLPEGFVLKSNFQTDGKGMLSNSWESENNKNLLFSLLLYPDFLKAHEQFYLSKCLSLALVETFKEALPEKKCHIKWPNDIIVNGRKVSGTLIKSSLKGEVIQHCILGSGVNVNQLEFQGEFVATSIAKEIGVEFNINVLLINILSIFDNYYSMLKNEKESIDQSYIEHLFGYQSYHNYIDQEGQIIKGKITSILQDGRMMLQDSNGDSHCFDIKEVSLILA